ncbi:MAG TPA: hypothetical protein VFG54_13910 [Prolixibacteraceae bacterium]|nr:hypothetical protein [Prolixibacteraceae bacterium]
MENKQEQIELGYRISRIYTTKFTFEDFSEEELDNVLNKSDNLNIIIHTFLNIENEKSMVNLDVISQLVEKENEKSLVEHSGRTSFEFIGLEGYYNKERDVYDLPDNVAIQIYSIAYTHARALLAVETSRTVYKDKYFLPVIDPNLLIQARDNEKLE